MKVTQEFIDNLGFRGGWKLETINAKTYLVLNDPTYCHVFWMTYWKDVLSVSFRNQQHITFLANGQLRTKVIIDRDTGNLLATPAGWSAIEYFGNFQLRNTPPLTLNINASFIIISYFVFAIIFIAIVILIPNNRKNTRILEFI
jgi:hypothetical protein